MIEMENKGFTKGLKTSKLDQALVNRVLILSLKEYINREDINAYQS